jgi:hypothetical protein
MNVGFCLFRAPLGVHKKENAAESTRERLFLHSFFSMQVDKTFVPCKSLNELAFESTPELLSQCPRKVLVMELH